MCDNRDTFVTNSVGSFVDDPDGKLYYCQVCGGSSNCKFEFRITKRYAGDNYKVYIQTDDYPSQTYFARAVPKLTAVKNVFIERDKMCRNGGVLYKSYGAPGECGGTNQPPCCGTGNELPCNQIKVYDWMSGIGIGNSIVIFDETKPFESANKEIRTVLHIGDNGDGTKTITLDSPLQNNYLASDYSGNPPMPIFSNGHSAGICFNTNDNSYYYIADTSDLRQPFDDGFVKFNVSADGVGGSGVGVYLV